MKRSFLFLVMGFLSLGALAGEFSITVAPTAHLDYRGEGKISAPGVCEPI
jgi:hypothetical protein